MEILTDGNQPLMALYDRRKGNCFIIMPICTTADSTDMYKGDPEYFKHVLEFLFIPAPEKAGFKPVPSTSTGSEIIQAEPKLETSWYPHD